MNDSEKSRTKLANERTLLAYIRTALAIIVFGMAAVKFFPETRIMVIFGWFAIAIGIFVLFWGFLRFYRIKKSASEKL